MNLIKEITQYFSDNTSYTIGTNLYIGEMPVEVANGIYFVNGSGTQDEYTATERMLVECNVRDTNSEQAYTVIQDIINFWHRKHDIETDNFYIYEILGIDNISDFGRDGQNRKHLRYTLRFTFRNKNFIS